MSEHISYQTIVIQDHTEKEWKDKLNKDLRDWLSEDFMLSVGIGEAVNNAIEHGEFPVILELQYTKHTVDMRIKDHGKGFNVAKKFHDIEKYGTEKL